MSKTALRLLALILITAPCLGATWSPSGEPLVLVPKDPGNGEAFGRSAAVHGSTAVIGSYDRDNPEGSGAAYLFDADTGAQTAKLLPLDGHSENSFGQAVDVHGDVAIVGAPGDEELGYRAGAAYLFDRRTGQQQHKLLAEDGRPLDRFGTSVAIHGDLAVVATYRYQYGAATGAVYFFDVTTGQQIRKLVSEVDEDDLFGAVVDTNGVHVLVASPIDTDDSGELSGSVSVYDAATGELLRKLRAPADSFERFGSDLALSGPLAVIGAMTAGDNGPMSGSAYLFDVSTGAQLARLLPSDGEPDARFGQAVGISGDIAVVGTWGYSIGLDISDAYLFDVPTGRQLARVSLVPRGPDDAFGAVVAIGGTTLVVGARRNDELGNNAGRAYVFDAASQFGAAFCDDSDDALTSCPCANPGGPGTGCDLPQGTGGVALGVVAQQTAPINRVTLAGSGFSSSQPAALVLRSSSLATGGPSPFGDGLLCIGAPVARLAATFASGGASTHVLGHSPMAGAGVSYYQLFFRSQPAAFCDPAAAFNLSNASALVW